MNSSVYEFQASGLPFNRGMLANIGYRESMLDMDYDCLVIHDLDILPEDDRNFYICMNNPVHMAVNVEQCNNFIATCLYLSS